MLFLASVPYGPGLFPTLTLVYYLPRWLLPYQNPASTTLLLSRVCHISSCKTNYLVVCRSKKWILFYQNWQNFLRYVTLRLFRAKYFILNGLVGVTSTYKPFFIILMYISSCTTILFIFKIYFFYLTLLWSLVYKL